MLTAGGLLFAGPCFGQAIGGTGGDVGGGAGGTPTSPNGQDSMGGGGGGGGGVSLVTGLGGTGGLAPASMPPCCAGGNGGNFGQVLSSGTLSVSAGTAGGAGGMGNNLDININGIPVPAINLAGGGGGAGGGGALLTGTGNSMTAGNITGGAGGAGGGGPIIGQGPGLAGGSGGGGGSGVTSTNGGSLSNGFSLAAGSGGAGGPGGIGSFLGNGGNGGAGGIGAAFLNGGSFTNSGAVTGGGGGVGGAGAPGSPAGIAGFGGTGGAGTMIVGGGLLSNSGSITGGNGGAAGANGNGLLGFNGVGGAAGGAGVITDGNVSLTGGTIAGGNGGQGGKAGGGVISKNGGDGGAGGVGLMLTNGGTLTSSGVITDGNGALGGKGKTGDFGVGHDGNPGAGGAGLTGAGVTIINGGTIAGGMSADGLVQANAITFTSGNNTLTLVGANPHLSGNIEIDGNGSVIFNQSTAQSVGSAITGNGSIVQSGTGRLTLTGVNTFTGATIVNAGALEVDGSIASSSSVTVNAGAMLSGTGIVDPAVTTIIGLLAPGNAANPTGSLTFTSNLAFQPGGLYRVQVTPTNAASTVISGPATLTGANVQTVFAPGSFITNSYDVLHATGGLGGSTFAGVSGNTPAGFLEFLTYTPTDVILNLRAMLAGSNPNQQSVANALNTSFNNGNALPPGFLDVFNLSGGSLGNALSQLSGESSTGLERGAFQLTNQFLELLLDPWAGNRGAGRNTLGFAPEQSADLPADVALAFASILKVPPAKAPSFDQHWNVWASAFGGTGSLSGNPAAGSNSLTASDFGFAAGADSRVNPNTLLGFALAGGGTNWNLAQGLGGGRSDAFQFGLYSRTTIGPTYVSAALSFANHWFNTNRTAGRSAHRKLPGPGLFRQN